MSSKESRAVALGIAPEPAKVLANHSIATGLTATGSAITNALALAAEFNLVATTAASTGVQLPDWPIGCVVYVRNDGANTLNVFPHSSSGTINAGSGGAAQTVATTKKGRFIRLSAINWDYTLEN